MALVKMVLAAAVGGLLVCAAAGAGTPQQKPEITRLRVGTFDSRAVTAAYAASDMFDRRIKQMMAELEKAKAAGDTEKVAQLEAEGKARQKRFHEQGFSTASVADILDQIKDKLPAIAKEAGVDVIVSKWDITYRVPTAEFVDVTELIVKPFDPNERTQRIIRELRQQPPIPLEKLRRMEEKGEID